MITMTDIDVVFNFGTVLEARALSGVNLTVNPGEFITVIGSNGAGKSTLLNVLAGDAQPSRGEVMIDDTCVTRLNTEQHADKIARIFQDPLSGTCADLTIEENMSLALNRRRRRTLAAAVSGKKRALFRERLAPLGMDLENRLGDLAGRLSGGERQALSLIMASLQDSALLLLDEPTAALDPNMAEFVMDLLGRIYREQGLTVLMVTHSMNIALTAGTRTLMLHQGEIKLDISGDERAAMTVPALLEAFARHTRRALDSDRLLLAGN